MLVRFDHIQSLGIIGHHRLCKEDDHQSCNHGATHAEPEGKREKPFPKEQILNLSQNEIHDRIKEEPGEIDQYDGEDGDESEAAGYLRHGRLRLL